MQNLEITDNKVILEASKGLSSLKLGKNKKGEPFGHLEILVIGSMFGSETITDQNGIDRKVQVNIKESLEPSTPSFKVLWTLLDCDNQTKAVSKAVNAQTAKELDLNVKSQYPKEYETASKTHTAPTGASALKGI